MSKIKTVEVTEGLSLRNRLRVPEEGNLLDKGIKQVREASRESKSDSD